MPTKHPRLCIVLDKQLYERIRLLARIKNMSMSSTVCALIKEALDLEEDLLLANYLREVEGITTQEKGGSVSEACLKKRSSV